MELPVHCTQFYVMYPGLGVRVCMLAPQRTLIVTTSRSQVPGVPCSQRIKATTTLGMESHMTLIFYARNHAPLATMAGMFSLAYQRRAHMQRQVLHSSLVSVCLFKGASHQRGFKNIQRSHTHISPHNSETLLLWVGTKTASP